MQDPTRLPGLYTHARLFADLPACQVPDADAPIVRIAYQEGWEAAVAACEAHLAGRDRISPTFDNILVRQDPAATHFGDVEIPLDQRQPPNTGIVIAVGPDAPPDAHALLGQRIVFPATAGIGIANPSTSQEALLLYKPDQILALASAAKGDPVCVMPCWGFWDETWTDFHPISLNSEAQARSELNFYVRGLDTPPASTPKDPITPAAVPPPDQSQLPACEVCSGKGYRTVPGPTHLLDPDESTCLIVERCDQCAEFGEDLTATCVFALTLLGSFRILNHNPLLPNNVAILY